MTTVEELLEKAERFAEQKRWEEAVAVARQAVDLAPQNRWAKDKLGWYLSRAKKHVDAIEVYRLLVQEEPGNYKYPYMLGYQYYDQQDYASAIPWFRKSLELRPDYMVVLYRCGYALMKTGDMSTAEESLRSCVRHWRELQDGDSKDREKQTYSNACFQLGKIHVERNDWDHAVNAFSESVNYDAGDTDKLYNLGKALVKTERFEEAIGVLSKADQLTPRKHYIQTYLAIALHRQSNLAEAERIFDAIPDRIKNQFPYIWQHHAELYRTQGRISEMIRILRGATRKPNEKGLHSWYDVFMLLASAYEDTDDIASAYAAYQNANAWHVKSRGRESQAAMEKLETLTQAAVERGVDLKSLELPEPSLMATGQSEERVAFIKKFFSDKGYGFIQQVEGGDLFVHIRNVINPDNIREGAHVEYQIGQGRKGLEATRVQILD